LLVDLWVASFRFDIVVKYKLSLLDRCNHRENGGISMKNIDMVVEGNVLTIRVDLSKRFGKSSSGKSIIIASTEGNQSIPSNDDIKIGLNVYTK
jgi:hypothetical protein